MVSLGHYWKLRGETLAWHFGASSETRALTIR